MFCRLANSLQRLIAHRVAHASVIVAGLLSVTNPAFGEVLLDDKWANGSRIESKRPAEAAVWTGRKADVATKAGALSTTLANSSQKIWTYFTDKEPVALEVGHKLAVSVSFIPRGKLAETTSRSFRIGVFHDPTSPRVEADINSDAGGPDAPWKDSKGYAVQMLLTGGEFSSTKPLDVGKRINFESQSLLGTSGDYAKVSGGEPAVFALDREYTLTLEIARVSDSQVDVMATIRQGKEQLTSWSISDDGNSLGSEPVYDKFDQLFIRINNNSTTADKIEFTNFRVELVKADAEKPQTTDSEVR
jgi:hypothetical protein